MANTKNTIQNISLTGPLCLNKLKTDVTQFEGYNEKNTTVFGGELVPIHEKKTELGDKDDTYTIFNSKGEPFSIVFDSDWGVYLNIDGTRRSYISIPRMFDLSTPENTIWSQVESLNSSSNFAQMCLTSQGKLFFRYGDVNNPDIYQFTEMCDFNRHFSDVQRFTFIRNYSVSLNKSYLVAAFLYNNVGHYELYYAVIDYVNTASGPDIKHTVTNVVYLDSYYETPFITIVPVEDDDTKCFISAVPFSGKREISDNEYHVRMISVELTQDAAPQVTSSFKNYFFRQDARLTASEVSDEYGPSVSYISIDPKMQISDFTPKTVEVTPYGIYIVYQGVTNTKLIKLRYLDNRVDYTGHDGNYFIPGVKIGSIATDFKTYYLDGLLYCVSINNRLLCLPGDIDELSYSLGRQSITIKGSDGKCRTYIPLYGGNTNMDFQYFLDNVDKIIIDKRYIPIHEGLFDIETKKIIEAKLGYVDTAIPIADNRLISSITDDDFTTIIYATGYNVNYPISKIPFTSLLMNPRIMVDIPKFIIKRNWNYWASGVELFYSTGENVQSAVYQGDNIDYLGTVYPIDINGNIIYPITWNSGVIKGYSNNDLVKDGDTTYPLIYWNNNQKMYSFYLLSSMEGITGAFALQGQQYTLDDDNIYNIQFNNGVIQNVTTVCYKKNMQFLGTLPTSAVFYSKYNKTFYQFTGDNILNKMFEANDINEIKMVGQNPSTLSLWICTDTGVYVMSDTDMFKLDYDAEDIYFNDEKTIIVTDELIEDTHKWIEHDISLYDIGDEAEEKPVKLATKYYGLGSELKANLDCWYIRLHNADHKNGKLKLKVNTITNTSFETEEKTFDISKNMYDVNNQVYIRYQPKFQTAVAMQLELESDIAIYQISLGVNATDAVAQQSKFNF